MPEGGGTQSDSLVQRSLLDEARARAEQDLRRVAAERFRDRGRSLAARGLHLREERRLEDA
jgi:hypothetical protein